MFVWFSCQNAYEDAEEKKRLTDLDIVCFREGKFLIGEVKSEPTAFTEEVVPVMGEVADDLEPDEVVFAAPGEFPPEVLDRLRVLRDRLVPIGASVTPLPLSW